MLNIFYGCMCHNTKHILGLNIHVYSDINLSDIDHGSTCGSLDDCLILYIYIFFGVSNSDKLLIHNQYKIHKQYKNYVPQRFACAW